MHNKVNILGIQVSSITLPTLLNEFKDTIRLNSKASVCITPVNSILAANKNAVVKNIYNNATYTLCDGVPVLWASKFLGTPIAERITGLDLLPSLLPFCSENNFIEENAEIKIDNLAIKFLSAPNDFLISEQNGYYNFNVRKNITATSWADNDVYNIILNKTIDFYSKNVLANKTYKIQIIKILWT